MEYVLFKDGSVVAIDDTLQYPQLLAILTTVEGTEGYYWRPGSETVWQCISLLPDTNENTTAPWMAETLRVAEPPDVIALAQMLL